ncbi:MAG: hypothetical protein EA384_08255 [Spirochaetaceae bacterium]|nr:MAG: hypothetical protein EA384_08255 [Spirochaetaceae bacterium]
MVRKIVAVATAGILVACASAAAREYSKPPAMVNPLRSVTTESSPWIPAGYFSLGHWRYDIRRSKYNLFEMRTQGAATVFQHDARFGLGLFFSSILDSGPGPEDWDTPTRVGWRMDAVQFEYGLNLGYRLRGVDVMLEYSRSSFHPFRDKAEENYRIITTDYLRAAVMPPPLRYAALEGEAYLRSGWLDLYDAWGADYDPPRAVWKTTLGAWVDLPLREQARLQRRAGGASAGPHAFIYLQPELLFLRDGGADLDFYGELGLRLPGDFGNIDLFLTYWRVGDIEEVADREVTVNLVGPAIRFVTEPARRDPVVID